MNKYILIMLLVLNVGCGSDNGLDTQPVISNPSGQSPVTASPLDLEKYNGKSMFLLASNMRKILRGKTKDDRSRIVTSLEGKFHIRCENTICSIQKK